MGVTSRGLLILQIVLLLFLIQDVTARRSKKKFKILTFNADLNNILKSRVTRRDSLITALKESPADLVCLQEIYFGTDMEAIVSGLSDKYQYSFSDIHQGPTLPQQAGATFAPACSTTLNETVQCLKDNNCTAIPFDNFDEFQACAGINCGSLYATNVLTQGHECITCVLFNSPDTDTIQTKCTSIGTPTDNLKINAPGLLMLSKKRLSNPSFVDIFNGELGFFQRGYLQAMFHNKFKAVCSHLSSDIVGYAEPFIGPKFNFTSYRQQNLYEAQQIINTFKNEKKVVIPIDLNSGLSFGLPGINERIPETYNAMAAAFNIKAVQECITCLDNTFSSGNNTIDQHVFTGKSIKPRSAKRVLTERIPFENTMINLSDNFGALVKVKCKSGKKRNKN